jgi:hypothetical protein
MTTTTNSTIVAALEQAWAEIRVSFPDVPVAVLVVASGSSGRTLKWGHYAAGRWSRKVPKGKEAPRVPEVLISGEGFQRGGKDVMTTLLHEAAHGLAATRKLKDTSRNSRYHNRTFKRLAEELGLEVKPQGSFGLADTSMTPETEKRWKKTIQALNRAIKKSFRFAEGKGQGKEATRMLLAVCSCNRKIRLSRATYDDGPIICRVCERHFEIR